MSPQEHTEYLIVGSYDVPLRCRPGYKGGNLVHALPGHAGLPHAHAHTRFSMAALAIPGCTALSLRPNDKIPPHEWYTQNPTGLPGCRGKTVAQCRAIRRR